MTAENIFDSLQRVTENEERPFECRKNIIKALSENKELVDRLELKFIELVDLLLKKASDKADKKDIKDAKTGKTVKLAKKISDSKLAQKIKR